MSCDFIIKKGKNIGMRCGDVFKSCANKIHKKSREYLKINEERKKEFEKAPEKPVKEPDKEPEKQLEKITMKEVKEEIIYPSSILMIGKKFSGKTNLIRTLIDKNKFNNVFIITQSGHTGNLTKLATDPDNIIEIIDDETIDFILDFQKENKKSKTLIIFDDFIESERTLRAVPKVLKLATSGRNFNVSILVSSQTVAQVPTGIRKNAEYLFIGKNMMSSAEQLSREYANGQLSIKELKKEIMDITNHSWLFYNERKSKWNYLPETEIKVVI